MFQNIFFPVLLKFSLCFPANLSSSTLPCHKCAHPTCPFSVFTGVIPSPIYDSSRVLSLTDAAGKYNSIVFQ